MIRLVLAGSLLAALFLAAPFVAAPALAEYRAYELEITDIFDCRLNKREKCKIFRIRTAMEPDLYARTHGGSGRIGVVLLATWFCGGDTSNFKQPCPTPPPKKPKFSVGDEVTIHLKKHITEGWRGKIELAYHQKSISSNVYGVRFADYKQVYARYFEKDLTKITPAASKTAPSEPNAQPAEPRTTPTEPNAQPAEPKTTPTEPNAQPAEPNAAK